MTNKRTLGENYEMLAVNYLLSQGYTVIERNFFMRGGELDLIAEKENVLCFIEVKYRRNENAGNAAEAVTPSKIKNIIKTARFWLLKHPAYGEHDIRFDVIAITGVKFEHIISAFDAC